MRNNVLVLSILALAATGCAQTPQDAARAQADAAATQAKLGKELAGLAPSGTSDCLDYVGSTSMKAFGSTLVYTANPNLKYVTNTGGGCEAVQRGDVLVTKSPTGRLCRGDIATTVMPQARVQTGSCAIGGFTVYKREK